VTGNVFHEISQCSPKKDERTPEKERSTSKNSKAVKKKVHPCKVKVTVYPYIAACKDWYVLHRS